MCKAIVYLCLCAVLCITTFNPFLFTMYIFYIFFICRYDFAKNWLVKFARNAANKIHLFDVHNIHTLYARGIIYLRYTYARGNHILLWLFVGGTSRICSTYVNILNE